ncbi:MAG: arginine--tRNA ligase [Armatimonadota bacterium]|nr:arginine--tRNA ligase [Armatimonadota bacterium]MDR7451119.1 arginine--tRNA ligase [Armatimonadota bacterium]MDR7467276.1 arginine--tRNA ligase [Armatimonadota bacterium]MDR7494537.1 arginine--tRNA ligase [Armatimonadota bacterium]MDR7499886.1 arginine--tRNA ligase [Armatimonadota bacterium]
MPAYAFDEAAAQVTSGVREALGESVDVPVVLPPAGVEADLAVPCFSLASTLRRSPEEIARHLAERIPPGGLLESLQGERGYLNVRLKRTAFGRRVLEEIARLGERYGSGTEGEGQTVVLDISSPNVARPMSVGHLRSTIIGDALRRLYAFSGYRAIGVNHYADWGTQFGTLLYGMTQWLDGEAYRSAPIRELLRLYVKFDDEARREPGLREEARRWALRLEQGDPEARRMWEEIVSVSLAEFGKIYDLLGVTFDSWRGESAYLELAQEVVEEAQRKGVAVEDQGALIVPLQDVGIETPLILRSRDGRTLYPTRDVAAAVYRIRTYRPSRLIYVVGADQRLHFRQLFATLRKLGYTGVDFVHVDFGLITLPEGRMSTRRGRVVFLEDVLQEAIARARALVEKNPELSDAEKDEVARIVGVGAIKYADLSQNRVKNIVFQWERMLSLEGDSAPYLQYTYVRAQGIRRRGEAPPPPGGIDGRALETAEEWTLVKQLSRFPVAVREATHSHAPHLLANCLFALAQVFHAFYHQVPVQQAGDESLRASRMAMVEATAQVMRTGLGLLGIRVPERM